MSAPAPSCWMYVPSTVTYVQLLVPHARSASFRMRTAKASTTSKLVEQRASGARMETESVRLAGLTLTFSLFHCPGFMFAHSDSDPVY